MKLDPCRRRFRMALLAAVVVATPAAAEDARLTPPLIFAGDKTDGLWAYGQINKGFLVHDDGEKTKLHPLVDNANSSTRGGLWYRLPAADDFTFLANAEAEWNPYSTGRVNLLNDGDVDWSQWKLRKAEAIFDIAWLGRLHFGQGASASDASAEQDLSGTSVIAYSSVGDAAGGQLFALSGGGLSQVSIGSSFSNLDGLGRYARFRYDTPEFAGFRLKASVGNDWIGESPDAEWDLAAVYGGETGAYKVAAAAAFARVDGETNRFSASSSFLHDPSGVSLTAAAGHQNDAGPRTRYYGYLKLGWQDADLVSLGRTAFAVDLYAGSDIAKLGSSSTSVGLAAVQTLSGRQTELYGVVRWHDYDDPDENFETALSFLTGARFKF